MHKQLQMLRKQLKADFEKLHKEIKKVGAAKKTKKAVSTKRKKPVRSRAKSRRRMRRAA